jgi:diguanylate cyclase (GGDEF)-like protein/PAS domain S-box-containing protein
MDIISERYRGLRRPLLPDDIGGDAQLKRVYAWWQANAHRLIVGEAPASVLADFPDDAKDLIVIDRRASDDWFCHHYGDNIARQTGFHMAGGTTKVLDPDLAAHFHEIYGDFLDRAQPGYSISPSNMTGACQVWQRHIFPGPVVAGQGRCLALFRPLTTRAETMADLGASGRIWASYLQPIQNDARDVIDFLLIDVVQPEPHGGFTWRPATLSKLLKRPLKAEELPRLMARDGTGKRFSERVPVTIGTQEQELKVEVFAGEPRNLLIVTDVTSEFRAMRALVQAEKLAGLTHWRWDVRLHKIELSVALRNVFGLPDSAKHLPLREFADHLYGIDGQKFIEWIQSAHTATAISPLECRARVNGAMRHFRLKADQRRDVDGSVLSIFGVLQDITDLKQAQHLLEDRTRELSEAQKIGRIADWSQNLADKTVWWSPQMFDILGYDPATFEMTLERVASCYTHESLALIKRVQKQVIVTGELQTVDVQAHKGDGSIGDYMIAAKVVRGPKGDVTGLVGTIQDVTERKTAQRQLEKLAYYDPLTGCCNRALFNRELEEQFALTRDFPGAVSFAVFLIDLDNFKEVNDSLGHAAGDTLLVRATERLRALMRPGDSLARLGGDEFAIINRSEIDEEHCADLAASIIKAISAPFTLPDGEAFVGASIGAVLLPQHAQNAEETLRNADLALYNAKENGRNRCRIFDSSLNDEVQHRTQIGRRLRHAIDTDELTLHFQTQVSLADHGAVGVEALLRWPDEERGHIPPSEFIPIAESSNLILDVGLWTLNESCRIARQWRDAATPFGKVSVNTSAAQIWQTNFVREVRDALERHGLPASSLCIEVTESLFIDHSQARVSSFMAQLRELGVSLSLDDFGTGYSSLSYLNQLPFDQLKIDRSFVTSADHDPRRQHLLAGIVALGNGLGMSVIAEGVETPSEIAVLRSVRCPSAQGFAFSRPVPALSVAAEIDRIRRLPLPGTAAPYLRAVGA